MRTSALFGEKNKTLDSSKFMVCPHGQEEKGGGVEPVWTMGKQVNFFRFCAYVLLSKTFVFVRKIQFKMIKISHLAIDSTESL